MPPREGTQPPTYPKPAPRAVTGMRWRVANAMIFETEFAEWGRATASGRWVANHLSPECRVRVSGSRRSSPRGRILRRRRYVSGEFTLRDLRSKPADCGHRLPDRLGPGL